MCENTHSQTTPKVRVEQKRLEASDSALSLPWDNHLWASKNSISKHMQIEKKYTYFIQNMTKAQISDANGLNNSVKVFPDSSRC